MNKKAFTLIELLVVVLIIGILAAIALPQYEISVAKTKFSNLQTLVHSYARAAQVYYSNEGKWPDSFDVLDIDAPGGMTIASNTYKSGVCATNDKLYCCVNEFHEGLQVASIVCGIADYKFAYQYQFDNSSRYCYGKNGTIGEKLCKTMNGTLSSGNLPTPAGHKVDYTVYKI